MNTNLSLAFPVPRVLSAFARVAVFSAILVCLGALAACTRTAAQPADPGLPRVTVAQVIPREITEWDEFTGRLEAVHTVAVRPRVSGYISAVRFSEGALVRPGDRL